MTSAEEAVRRLGQRQTFTKALRDMALDREDAISKAAVPAGSGATGEWGAELGVLPGSDEFREMVRRRSILDRGGFQAVPFGAPTPIQTGRPQGYRLTTPGFGKPITTLPTTSVRHEPNVHGVILVFANELLLSMAPDSDEAIARQLASGVASVVNTSFLDPSVTGSITNGVAATPSTTVTLADDLVGLLEVGDAPIIVASLPWAVAVVQALGEAASLVPVLVTPEADDLVIGVDPAAVAVSVGMIEITPGPHATIEMADSGLTGDASDGTGTSLVSMYQTNCSALRAELHADWTALDGAVAALDMAGS